MGLFFLVAGIAIFLFTIYDMSITVLGSQGAGVLTDYSTKILWSFFLKITENNGLSPVLQYGGIFIIITIMASWIILLWTGTTLIFLYKPTAVVDSITNQPVDLSAIVYFSGYVLATLGNGDLKPGGPISRFVANILSFSGLIFITMTVSYLMNVLSGDTQKRKLSKTIIALGYTPFQISQNLLNKDYIDAMESQLAMIGDNIFALSKNLESYPILHYYHTSRFSESMNLNIVMLDEALSLIFCAHNHDKIYKKPLLLFIRKGINSYLQTQQEHINRLSSKIPSLEHIEEMDWSGFSIPRKTIVENYEKIKHRRTILQTLLEQSGFKWKHVFERNGISEEFE
jgi:hypothetical protein